MLIFQRVFVFRYLFYEVNPGEGFNLRRDVYMRIAVLVKNLQKFGNFMLVIIIKTILFLVDNNTCE